MVEIEDRREKTAHKLKESNFFKKLKGIKNIEIIACVFILAIALLLFSLFNGHSKTSYKPTQLSPAQQNTSLEGRLEGILSQIDGAGQVSVLITYASEVTGGNNSVSGVVIVSSGASDISVRLNIIRAAQTALGIDSRYIEVFAKK